MSTGDSGVTESHKVIESHGGSSRKTLFWSCNIEAPLEHRESLDNRGKIQDYVYIIQKLDNKLIFSTYDK